MTKSSLYVSASESSLTRPYLTMESLECPDFC
jgi:hypothetical protein